MHGQQIIKIYLQVVPSVYTNTSQLLSKTDTAYKPLSDTFVTQNAERWYRMTQI